MNKKPKVLLLDIETAPILAFVWGIWDQTVALNQIKENWSILSWSAKWFENDKGELFGPHNRILYKDQRNQKNIEDDKNLIKDLLDLINEADVIITHNGDKFDHKKINTRIKKHKLPVRNSYKSIDTLKIAKKHFAFTSNKLEHLCDFLSVKYKKLKHKEFPGFELWKECLKNNKSAWKEMEAYNKRDVLALEEVYKELIPWDNSVNFNLFHDSEENICKCGNKEFQLNGFVYTTKGKFQRYKCKKCGSQTRGTQNHFSEAKINSLRVKI